MPRLFALSGHALGESFELADGAVIGRAPGCDVRLADASISRRHARLERDGLDWRLVDLGSRNGVFQGGERVEQLVLIDFDEFSLGDVQLRFRLDLEQPPAADAPAPAASAPPAEAQRSAPAPARSGGEPAGGLELEEDIDLEALAPPESASKGRSGPRAAEPAPTAADARRAEILRSPSARGSLLTDSLDERPPWMAALILVVALALMGGLAWGVFQLVVGARGG